MIRHLIRKQRCSTYGCSNIAEHTLVIQTPSMPAAGFYHYCDSCKAELDESPYRPSRYSIIKWRELV